MDLVKHALDGNLLQWPEVSQQHDWGGILLGNGASLVVWDKFKYGSLFETARTGNRYNQLGSKDLQFFKALDTENFEAVLDALSTYQLMHPIVDGGQSHAQGYYANVQHALF